jgi:hypothetical protein
MTKRCLFLVAFLFALAGWGGAARAQMLGDTKVGFTADRTVVFNGRSFGGRIYAMPGRQRHELDIEGMAQVILLRSDGKGWLVVPAVKSYVEFTLGRAFAELSDPNLLKTPVGQETVSGVATTKYRVDHPARDGTKVEGFIWRSADGVVMKLDGAYTTRSGKPTPIRMQLSNLRIGPQDSTLFDPPPGMMQLPASALQPLLGLGQSPKS